jgi:hypothetical protein
MGFCPEGLGLNARSRSYQHFGKDRARVRRVEKEEHRRRFPGIPPLPPEHGGLLDFSLQFVPRRMGTGRDSHTPVPSFFCLQGTRRRRGPPGAFACGPLDLESPASQECQDALPISTGPCHESRRVPAGYDRFGPSSGVGGCHYRYGLQTQTRKCRCAVHRPDLRGGDPLAAAARQTAAALAGWLHGLAVDREWPRHQRIHVCVVGPAFTNPPASVGGFPLLQQPGQRQRRCDRAVGDGLQRASQSPPRGPRAGVRRGETPTRQAEACPHCVAP